MAERRMFAKTIVLSDAFLDMPMSARCLYFTLGMLADDDGFVNSPKGIMRQCGASEDDMRVLIAKRFLLVFDSGVIVIKHWRINNYLRSDRYAETKYIDEKHELNIEPNGAYRMNKTAALSTESYIGIPSSGTPSIDKDSIEKNSIGEDSADTPKRTRFVPPTADEVAAYCTEKHLAVDAQRFVDFYTSKGWRVGSSPMKDWRAAARNWASRDRMPQQPARQVTAQQYTQREYTEDDLEARAADLIAEAAGL